MERRRQARGERRMAEILDAAADAFAELGYEKASTNAIAARAGISPGSLYQFFPSKEAVARALADRFVTDMRAAHASAFGGADVAGMDLGELLDLVVDPLVAFNLANPGFKALFARPDMPSALAESSQPIQAAMLGQVESILDARVPGLAPADRARSARVLVRVFQAMTPLVAAAPEEERPAEIAELKRVLGGYLTSLSA
ncbi:TetR/AcrR family transcriptional regulator [Herbidospora yilanensis]|uniref:TetR/AcrR family transcriptional regulator n=1 Tax=Herbidospora yilanensis TaxID=354426 RepID=UPI0007850248|nr:TetR/AcrR family transcriptional regulator [Herbidospora yilanensis]